MIFELFVTQSYNQFLQNIVIYPTTQRLVKR